MRKFETKAQTLEVKENYKKNESKRKYIINWNNAISEKDTSYDKKLD